MIKKIVPYMLGITSLTIAFLLGYGKASSDIFDHHSTLF